MTNAVIGALRVNLGIDTAQFSDGLKQAQSSADKFAGYMKTAFVAAAAAAAAALGAIAVGVRNSLKEADAMDKMASKIGIPIEELSKLKYAAEVAGISMEGLQTGVGKLAKNMDDVAHGKGPKAFERLGISVTDAGGKMKTTSQVMAEISDKFAKMPNGAEKTALAMQLMGKSGADMIPLLNGGSAALNGMLAEAKALGLEISSNTAAKAAQFEENMSKMTGAIHGLVLGLTAALAPALATISDAMVGFVKWVVRAVEYLPVLAEDAAVAAGALALMFAPAILAAANSLATAIAVGLVGAVRLLTAVIVANPLGALAVGITIAVTAIYHFRDEIQKAIGVDVVGIVKGAANLFVGAWVGTFKAVKTIWNDFPAIMGDVAAQAGNLWLAGIEKFLNLALEAVKQFYRTLNPIAALADASGNSTLSSILGTGLLPKDISVGRVGRTGAATAAAKDIYSGFKDAFSHDWVGEIGKAFAGSTPAVLGMNNALRDTGDLLDDIGGAGKKGGSGKVAKVKNEFDGVGRAIENAQQTLGHGFSGVLQGLIDKSLSWKDALLQAGQALLKYLNQMNLAQGGGGLFGGGLLQGLIGGLIGFANGGTILPGGAGGIDSQVVAFRKSPTEQVDVYDPRKAGGRGSMHVTVGVATDGNGNLLPFVQSVARGEAGRATAAMGAKMPGVVDRRVDTRQIRRTRA
ncbi:phage tail tape measure protein [Mesorhizobium sp. KR1-2]|uniref:phage tail tape measure protein n=1 Tax=Mesorhizobium sp. KR1-2 TaxID=3156609 RepID=UPI0032B40F29